MKFRLAFLTVLVAFAVATFAQEPPLRVFIRAGKKTHGVGEHDYPQFLTDWKKLLSERGAAADGALSFPRAEQLAKADVMLIYSGDAGTMNASERERLLAFTARGGGLVVLHDGICGNDADWFKTVIGGAKQHGVTNWHRGKLELAFTPLNHPITKGVGNFTLDDEMFHTLHLAPSLTVLATTEHNGEAVPQLWCYEQGSGPKSSRAFVSLQGHYYRNLSTVPYRGLLLRGIAWAGKRDVNLLTKPEDFPR
ncbi:MAG: ThuA domain-containing protein [Verrucomicrobia bacterium]|nr:ThuA domain-containing protein [Verrucomicrobiota bacterium]